MIGAGRPIDSHVRNPGAAAFFDVGDVVTPWLGRHPTARTIPDHHFSVYVKYVIVNATSVREQFRRGDLWIFRGPASIDIYKQIYR
jgi:hypothetical protein